MHISLTRESFLRLSPRVLVWMYIGWIASCIIFFVMGLNIGKFSVSAQDQEQFIQSQEVFSIGSKQDNDKNFAQATSDAKYAVQVTIVNTASEANQIVAELRRKGFTSAYIILSTDKLKSSLYSIKVGFYNHTIAAQVVTELQHKLGFLNAQIVSGESF